MALKLCFGRTSKSLLEAQEVLLDKVPRKVMSFEWERSEDHERKEVYQTRRKLTLISSRIF